MIAESLSAWDQFLAFAKKRTSAIAFENWLAPITLISETETRIELQVPNIFVQEYLLLHYKKDICAFLPVDASGEPAITFTIVRSKAPVALLERAPTPLHAQEKASPYQAALNLNYRFDNFIEGPTNQFVKSAAVGVASRPGKSYNPLFIHGGVGLGKTHLLHSIGHAVAAQHPNMRVQCITTEQFINDLVNSLRNKSVDKMKRYYRQEIDVLLVDDIQFLQNRLNFEEEFINTFEALINQNKLIVITSDQSPSELKLSERMVARMEWGLVAQIGIPELETRVAILQYKAQQKGLELPQEVAFYIAEHIYNNVRQLEGAVNKLSAHSKLLNLDITLELVEIALKGMFQRPTQQRVTVDQILKSVAAVFEVRVTDLKGASRTKNIALPRQVAMFLACKLINESLQMIGSSFGKTHSTLLHACKAIEHKMEANETLRRQIDIAERNVNVA